jgi:hypothetical protein
MDQIIQKPAPNPLPATVQDLEAMRKVFHQPTLNDRVDAIHIRLWPNDKYRRFLDAVYDEDAVEGSLSADNIFAAMMIREFAAGKGGDDSGANDGYVATKKVATIAKSLGVVLRRYGIGRRERSREVAGQIMDNGNSE